MLTGLSDATMPQEDPNHKRQGSVMELAGPFRSHRRDFLATASLVGASLAVGPRTSSRAGGPAKDPAAPGERGYKYRVAFGCWINDMRSEALPLQQWPAPHLDDVTVSSVLAAMDVQSRAGFNYLDVWGLFATYGYPPDIVGAFDDEDRARRVTRLIDEGSPAVSSSCSAWDCSVGATTRSSAPTPRSAVATRLESRSTT